MRTSLHTKCQFSVCLGSEGCKRENKTVCSQKNYLHQSFDPWYLSRLLSFTFMHGKTDKSLVLPAQAHITSYSQCYATRYTFTVLTHVLPRGTSSGVNQRHFCSGPRAGGGIESGGGGAVWFFTVLRIRAPQCVVPPHKYFTRRTK